MKKELATATKYTYVYKDEKYVLINKARVYIIIIDEKQIIDEDKDRYFSGRKIGKDAPTKFCSKDNQGYYNAYKNIVIECEC